jgi:hypothetical protein
MCNKVWYLKKIAFLTNKKIKTTFHRKTIVLFLYIKTAFLVKKIIKKEVFKMNEKELTQTEVKLIELGRKILKAELTDNEVLEQMKLLIDFTLYLFEIDLKHERQLQGVA